MSQAQQPAWLGNCIEGGRLLLSKDELKAGLFILGRGSNDLAALTSLATHESGLRTLVLDLSGEAAGSLSSRIPAYSVTRFLYDAMKMGGENSCFHAPLLASAYSTALDLSFEQEAVLDAVCQKLALEEGVGSPLALAERMEVEEHGGSAGKRLRGRLNSLAYLNAVGEEGEVSRIISGSAVLDFGESPTLESAELSAALVIAKVMAEGRDRVSRLPDVVVLLQANRLFRERPVFRQNPRLLSVFFASHTGKVLSSDIKLGLDRRVLESSPLRMFSGDSWNRIEHGIVLAPGMFAFVNAARGSEGAFIPRRVDFHTASVIREPVRAAPPPRVTQDILEAISTFGDSTRQSLVAYLSVGGRTEDIEKEIDRLLNEECIQAATRKGSRNQARMILRLTAKGEERLRKGE